MVSKLTLYLSQGNAAVF